MIILYVVVGLLGLVFGSFVNAFVWRLHEQAALRTDAFKKTKKSKKLRVDVPTLTVKELSITKGRSMCPVCHHTLAAKDLVPVLSWLSLRGKCRYCKAPIPDTPLPEIGTGLLFVLSYVALRPAFGSWSGLAVFDFVIWLFFVVMFMALTIYDLRWFLLPDRVVFPVIGVALLETAVHALWTHSFAALWMPLLGGSILFGLFYALFQISKGAWIGGGDVKLILALGVIAGSPLRAFLLLFLSSLLGTLASIPILLRGKKGLKVHIPFGPYLLGATVVVVLYGTPIINWYKTVLLPGY